MLNQKHAKKLENETKIQRHKKELSNYKTTPNEIYKDLFEIKPDKTNPLNHLTKLDTHFNKSFASSRTNSTVVTSGHRHPSYGNSYSANNHPTIVGSPSSVYNRSHNLSDVSAKNFITSSDLKKKAAYDTAHQISSQILNLPLKKLFLESAYKILELNDQLSADNSTSDQNKTSSYKSLPKKQTTELNFSTPGCKSQVSCNKIEITNRKKSNSQTISNFSDSTGSNSFAHPYKPSNVSENYYQYVNNSKLSSHSLMTGSTQKSHNFSSPQTHKSVAIDQLNSHLHQHNLQQKFEHEVKSIYNKMKMKIKKMNEYSSHPLWNSWRAGVVFIPKSYTPRKNLSDENYMRNFKHKYPDKVASILNNLPKNLRVPSGF